MSYDARKTLATFRDERGIEFPLLSDAGSQTIDAYGIRNPEGKGRTAGIPFPGFFVIDASGTIRAKLFERGYRDRSSIEDLIGAVEALSAEPQDPSAPDAG